MTSPVTRKAPKMNVLKNADYVKTFARRFGIGQWSFIGPGSEKKWYPSENSPQGAWDHIAEEMLLEFAESAHPIFRAMTPLSRGQLKSKGRGKLSIHFTADQDTVDTIYRIYSFCQSAQCLRSSGGHMRGIWRPSRYNGATCDTCGTINCSWRSQSRNSCPRWKVSWMTKLYLAAIHSTSWICFHQKTKWVNSVRKQDLCVLLKQDNISWPMDTGDFRQFNSVACREYTLPRDDRASQPEGWIQGNMRIGPVLEVTTSFQHFKYGIEIRIKSREPRRFSFLGQNFLWNGQIRDRFCSRQQQKFLQIHKKSEFHKQAPVLRGKKNRGLRVNREPGVMSRRQEKFWGV